MLSHVLFATGRFSKTPFLQEELFPQHKPSKRFRGNPRDTEAAKTPQQVETTGAAQPLITRQKPKAAPLQTVSIELSEAIASLDFSYPIGIKPNIEYVLL